jgi:tryptophan synthase alpha chain
MTTRLDAAFARARAENRAALVAYLTAFDGGREHTLACLRATADAGADVIELGVPFSDPSADGTTIQAAMVRALAAGATAAGVVDLVASFREHSEVPVVLFGYANPLLRLAAAQPGLAARAVAAGVDGVLVVDLPPEHASLLRDDLVAAGLGWVGLVAPTTTASRRRLVCDGATGFVYAITLRGVTGTAIAQHDEVELAAQITELRGATSLPIAAGFGVRTPADARRIAAVADGVVVGSALVEAACIGTPELARAVGALREAMSR